MTAGGFDPYYKWLGIPPEEQPPTFYRLLGIVQFEADADVIANATNRQMVHLRQLQQGQYAAVAQQLLKEVAAAKATLLNPEAKTQYDQSLIPAEEEQAEPEENAAVDFEVPIEELAAPPRVRPKVKKKQSRVVPLLIRVVPFLMIGFVLLFLLWIGDKNAAPRPELAATPAPPSDGSGSSQPAPPEPGVSTEPAAVLPVAEPARNLAEIDQGDAAEDLPAESMADEPAAGAESVAMKSTERKSTTADADDNMPDKMAPTESDSTDADSDKAAPPSDEEQGAAAKQVRAKYKADFAKAKTPELKIALAKKLLSVAQEQDDASTRQFALLKGAISLAAAGGDFELVAEAWNELGTRFDVDVLAGRWGTLKGALKTKNVDQLKAGLLEFAHDASDEDRYDLGRGALEALVELSDEQELKSIPLAELEKAATEFEQASAALAVLKSNPADAKSNRTAGEFYCFFKQDWPKGLVYLSRSDDEVLKKLARGEFAQPDDPKKQVALADAWWDYAQPRNEIVKASSEKRAVFWYQLALPDLSGSAREKAESRAALESRVHHESAPGAKITAEVLKSKFHGNASYDAQTNRLTLVYDLQDKSQLKDFDGEAKFATGKLGVPKAGSLRHVVKYKTLKMSGSVAMKSKTGDVIGSSGGLLAHRDGDTLKISSARESASSSEHAPTDDASTLPFEVDVNDKLVLLRLGDQVVGKPMAKHEVGQVQLAGGEAGAVFSQLTISGEPDREWLSEFFGVTLPAGEKDAKPTKSKPSNKYGRVKQIVLWNEHNGPPGNGGAQTCNLRLEMNGKEVWAQKDVEVPWSASEPAKIAVDVPQIVADAVRIEVLTWHGLGAGLAEVEVLDKAGKNLATGAMVIASAEHKPADPRTGAMLVDGVNDSVTHQVGYWMLPTDQAGWAVIRLLPQDVPEPTRPETPAGSTKEPAKVAGKPGRKTVDSEIFVSCDDEFEMYVNGELVLKGKENESFRTKFAFAARDVIAVKTTNRRGGAGFCCVIKFSNDQVITTSDGWGAYKPKNYRQWYLPAEINDIVPAIQEVSDWPVENVTRASGVEAEQIWGPTREVNAYLTYVVGPLDIPKKKAGK